MTGPPAHRPSAWRVGWGVLLAALCGPVPAGALSLDEARAIALEHRPELRAARADERAAASAADAARAERLPRVDLAVAAMRMDDPAQSLFAKLSQGAVTAADMTPGALNDPGALTDLSATVRVTQPLFAGGRIRAGVRAGNAAAAAAAAGRLEAVAETRAAVTTAYYGQILAAEALKVARGARRTARANLELANDRFEAGAAVRADLLAAQAHVARMSGRVIDATRDLALARATLAAAIGVEELPSDADAALPLDAGGEQSLDALLARAREARPMVRAARLAVERARAERDAAAGALWPEVGLTAAAGEHRPSLGGEGGTVWQTGIRADWRLADGGGRGARIAVANATLAKAEAQADQAWLAARTQVTAAHMSRQAALERIQAARLEVDAATEALRLTRDRYRAGAALFTELQEAQDRLAQARLNAISARHDLAVQEAALRWAVGDGLEGG
ncbi:MAG: TolC family protein [Nitrospirae bacterium]|nr:TolC family protein [Nitrospirota bacterium]